MIRNTTKRQKMGWVLFILYLCLLAYFMFFSESFGRTDTDRDYAYNLILFKEISRYFKYYNVLGFPLFMINIVGNIVAFAPFGFFLPVISRRSKKWYNTVTFGFTWSLILETLQLISKVGSFDVDDLFLNTLGAAFGFGCYSICDYVTGGKYIETDRKQGFLCEKSLCKEQFLLSGSGNRLPSFRCLKHVFFC